MKAINYILKFGCIFALSIVLMLQVGPYLITYHFEKEDAVKELKNLEEIRLELLHPSQKNLDYFRLYVQFSDYTFSKLYRVKENEHKELFKFLEKQDVNTFDLTSKNFPIILEGQKISLIDKIKVSTGEYGMKDGGILKTLIINDHYIIGKESGLILKGVSISIGIIIILVGGLIFLSGINLLIKNIKIFRKTGEFPELWNSVDTKVKGWKYILGITKKNK